MLKEIITFRKVWMEFKSYKNVKCKAKQVKCCKAAKLKAVHKGGRPVLKCILNEKIPMKATLSTKLCKSESVMTVK